MGVFVQQLATQLFFGKAGGWVKDTGDARDFRHTVDAVTYCATQGLKQIRVVMRSGDPALDVFSYPFGNPETRAEMRELQKRAKALKRKRKRLVAELQSTHAQLADLAQQLPLKRKKKRETPPLGD